MVLDISPSSKLNIVILSITQYFSHTLTNVYTIGKQTVLCNFV